MVVCEEIFKHRTRKTEPKIWKDPLPGICPRCDFCERCAVIAGQGINRKIAEQFVAAHFKLPVDIFLADELPPAKLVELGKTRPQFAKANGCQPQNVMTLKFSETFGYTYLNSLNLFRLKGGKRLIMVHGYSPDEMNKILKKGIAYFQKRKGS